MILDLLTEETLAVNVETKNWEEAVRTAGGLLYQNGFAEERYIDSMVDIVKEIGPYIVIIKGVALAHARPEQGAKKIGLSLVTLKHPVNFGCDEYDPVSMVFALCAVDKTSHIDVISEMAELFGDEKALEELPRCQTKAELLEIIRETIEK